jgi:hypothetical protein
MVQYILQMSDGRFLGKDLIWTDDPKHNPPFHSEHQDIVLNQLIELNAKNIDLRASVIPCDIDSDGNIIIPNNASSAA